MKNTIISIVFVGLCGSVLHAQTPFLDSVANPNYVAWEYQLDEVLVRESDKDVYNTALRRYKADALSSTDEVLEKLNGIWAIKRGNYAFEPVMRGLSAGQINVTIDEMRILGACTDKMDPVTSYVEPNNLQQLNVSQGAEGFHCGATVGGSFDMQIKKPAFGAASSWNAAVGTRYSSVNHGFSTLFNTSYKGEKTAIRLGGSYRTGQDYRAGGGEIVANSGYSKVNYSASASFRMHQNTLVNLSYIGDYAWQVGYPALPMDVGSAAANIVGLSIDKWYQTGFFNQLTGKVYYNKINHLMDDSHRDVIMRMHMPGNTNTTGAFVKGSYQLNEQISGQIKLDGYRSFAHAEMTMYFPDAPPMYMLTWPDVERKVIGFQNETSWTMTPKFTFKAGFRLEENRVKSKSELGERQVSVFGFAAPNKGELLVNGHAGLHWKLGEIFATEASLAYGQRMPSEGEQFGFYLFNAYDGYDYIGRPDLKSEQSTQIQVGISMEKKAFLARINSFYYHFDRYIFGKIDESLAPMTIGANGVKVYENLSFAMMAGFESALTLKLGSFTMSNHTKYTYGETINRMPLPLVPPFKDNLDLSFHSKNWLFSMAFEGATHQHRINSDFGEQATPGYFIANVGCNKTFHLHDDVLKLHLAVDNLFDRNYYEHLDWGGIPRMGRNIQVGVNFSF